MVVTTQLVCQMPSSNETCVCDNFLLPSNANFKNCCVTGRDIDTDICCLNTIVGIDKSAFMLLALSLLAI